MLIRPFLEWFNLAEADERVEAAEAFCAAYLDGHLGGEDPRETDAALTLLLHDPSPRIRHAVARFFAEEPRAPRHLVVALAHDQAEIAVPVLMRSPVLTDADLIDCASLGDAAIQIAIASRLSPSLALSAALAEIGCAEGLSALVKNAGSEIAPVSFARMAERLGHDADLRALLLEREDLPLVVRHALVIKVSEHLVEMICAGQWMPRQKAERLLVDARQSATVLLFSAAAPDEALELVDDMRLKGQLTPSLLLRALLSRDLSLFETSLGVLSGLPVSRIATLLRARHGSGFAALYRRARMPAGLMTTFRAAVAGIVREGTAREQGEEPRLSRAVIGEALLACAAEQSDNTAILGLLRRFEAEAARDEARRFSATLFGGADALRFEDNAVKPLSIADERIERPENAEEPSIEVDFAAIERELISFASTTVDEEIPSVLDPAEVEADLSDSVPSLTIVAPAASTSEVREPIDADQAVWELRTITAECDEVIIEEPRRLAA